jgi:hypothetical protein
MYPVIKPQLLLALVANRDANAGSISAGLRIKEMVPCVALSVRAPAACSFDFLPILFVVIGWWRAVHFHIYIYIFFKTEVEELFLLEMPQAPGSRNPVRFNGAA